MNYINIHGQLVTLDFRALARKVYPKAICLPRMISAKTGNIWYVYSDYSLQESIGVGATEDEAWQDVWLRLDEEATHQETEHYD